MAGFKVRCQCGFVFRLGPKDAKDKIAFEEKLARRKARRAERAERKNRQAGKLPDLPDAIPAYDPPPISMNEASGPIESAPQENPHNKFEDDIPDDPFEPVGPTHATTELAGVQSNDNRFDPGSVVEVLDDDEVLEAIPMDDPLMDLPVNELPVNPPLPSSRQGSASPLSPTSDRKPSRKSSKRSSRKSKSTFSIGGPVWTLVLAVFGTMFMFATLFLLGYRIVQTVYLFGNAHPVLVGLILALNILTFLMALATTIFLLIAGVLAALELSEKQYKTWGIRWAGRSALALMGCYFTVLIFGALGASQGFTETFQVDRIADNPEAISTAGLVAIIKVGWCVLACSVPTAIAITGFVRNR
jgi:hypothetical protein